MVRHRIASQPIIKHHRAVENKRVSIILLKPLGVHVLAVRYAQNHKGCEVFNIGTGKGSSVLDIVHAYEKACGKKIPYVIGPRRAGDLATVYADTKKANEILGFKAKYNLERMCADSWRWQSMNPKGFE